MSARKLRVLLVAEAANPEWVSVPLEGWSHCRALCELVNGHVVTQVRNRAAIERAGWTHGEQFTAIDSEALAAPLSAANDWLRRVTGAGWTLTQAIASVSYVAFEYGLWQQFGPAIRRGDFDVVHRVTPLSPTVPSLILSRACVNARVPFVWGPVNGGVPWPPGFRDVQHAEGEWLSYVRDAHKLVPGFRSTREHAAALIAGSSSAAEQLGRYRNKCVYVPENAIDPARFPTSAEPHHEGPVRVAFVGRLVPYKGADMLLEAAAPLIRAGSLVVDVIGDGPEMPRLRALRDELAIEQGVLLDGWVPHERLQERLRMAQVFGFPSLREFGGAVVLEAMATGLVPVVVGYAGPNELVSDSTGIRIPIGSREAIVRELRAALERLASNPGLIREMGQRARTRVQRSFTWGAKAAQVFEVYRWVLGDRDKPDFGMPLPDEPRSS